MKKFLPYIAFILILVVVAVWVIKSQSQGSASEQEGNFAVKNANDISRIVIADTEKNKVELSNLNGIWMVNGKYPAREDLVKQVLDAVTRVTSLCPVPSAAHDNVIGEMANHHVGVQIFGKHNTLIKSYRVGGPTIDGENTYMLLEEGGAPVERPHITYIPGFKGYLTPRFNTDEETWRTRVLFNYNLDEIKSLRVEYPRESQNSFLINKVSKDSFLLVPVDEKFRIPEPYQQKYIKQYLGFYSSIFIEAFDNDYSKKDSVIQTVPYCTITITEIDNSVNKVKLFYMPVSKRSKSQFDSQGNEMTYDIDHYHAGIHNEKDFVIVQYYVFGKLLRNYKDFFFKPA
jgi:hypothetical protein